MATRQVWDRHRAAVLDDVARLVRACTGDLEHHGREHAIGTAHNLAGSLGSFGYPEAGQVAAEIEAGLLADPADARLSQLARRLAGLAAKFR